MNRYVIYARYSSDAQSPESLEDQRRKCREFANQKGFAEVGSYEDGATSGSGNDRPGFQRLMADAIRSPRSFDIILVDDTSRLSRSLPDTLGLHQRLAHYGVRVIAVSQGIDTAHEQSDLMITFHGMTDSFYVKELAKKTHRGLEGKVLKGLSAGGRCYGYAAVAVEGGGSRLVINQFEASVVREIFEWSAAGYSLKKIAGFLNARKTTPPQKREGRLHSTWCPTAIREMLRRERYVGKCIWNQTRFVKTPGTNKRIARARPRSEWQILDLPELRIVSQDLWERVQSRQEALKKIYAQNGQKPVNRAASSPYLFSGFLVCGVCGAKLIIVSGQGLRARYGCPQYFNRRACSNTVSVRSREVERALFGQLQDNVVTPNVVDQLVGKLLKAKDRKTLVDAQDNKLAEIKCQIDRVISAIAATGHSDAMLSKLRSLEAEQRVLESRARAKPMAIEDVRAFVAASVSDIPALLSKGPELAKAKLSQHIDSIKMSPQPDGSYMAEGEWNLIGNGERVMVAGARFELATFGL